MHKIKLTLFLFIFLSTTAHLIAQCVPAVNGVVYQVTTNTDGGSGSLRQAILDANSANIGGEIQNWSSSLDFPISSQLPPITCDSLVIFPSGALHHIDGQGSVQEPGYVIISNSSCMDPAVTGINFLPATFTVTNTNDKGNGSLRRAIEYSNFSVSADFIAFNIPGQAPHAIQPNTELPSILHSLTINGSSQPPNGFTGSGPTIELVGLNNSFVCLDVDYDDINFHFSVFGMYIHGFNHGINAHNSPWQTGLLTIGSNQHRRNILSGNNIGAWVINDSTIVENTWFGTDTSGTIDNGNVLMGLSIIGSSCYLENNLISGNDSLGAFIDAQTVAKGNFVGTDKTGNFAIPNEDGFRIFAANGNIIFGGPNSGEGNLVSGNTLQSGFFQAKNITLCGNKFGTNITGTDTIAGGSNMNAAYLYAENIRVGGPTAAEGNIFAGPGNVGIDIDFNDSLLFMNNFVGTGTNGIGNFPFNIGIKTTGLFGTNFQLISGNTIANNSYGIDLWSNSLIPDSLVNNEIFNNTIYGIHNHTNREVFSVNSIYNNGKGIENDPNANNSIAPPIINFADNDSISGTSVPFATIELFYSLSFNANPQGYTLIGTTTADAIGNWIYQGIITNPTNVTTTQTDTSGNTSEFSALWFPNGISEDSESSTFRLFPNPASDAVNIIFDYHVNRVVSLIDITGRVVLQMHVSEKSSQINVEKLLSGVYVLEVREAGDKLTRTRLVIGF